MWVCEFNFDIGFRQQMSSLRADQREYLILCHYNYTIIIVGIKGRIYYLFIINAIYTIIVLHFNLLYNISPW